MPATAQAPAAAKPSELVAQLLPGCLRVAGVAAVAKLLAAAWRTWRSRRMLADVPHGRYRRHPVLGCLAELVANKHRIHDWRDEATRGLPVCQMDGMLVDAQGASSVLVCREPRLIRHFLKDNFDNYSKASPQFDPISYYMNQWLGKGIFTVRHGTASEEEGRNWTKQRKIGSSIFSRGNFNNNMHAVFAAKAHRMCEVLAAPAAEGHRVDMQKMFFSLTMDSVMKIFFGEEADTMAGALSRYAAAYDQAHNGFVDYVLSNMLPLKTSQLLPWPLGGVGGLL